MSGRVGYVSSTDRGDRLAAVRLIGARSEDSWRASGSADPIVVLSDVASAAAWFQDRLTGGDGRAGELAILCVDVEGANCTWLTAPSTDAAVVAAALAQTGEAESVRYGSAWSAPALSEASVEALAAGGNPANAAGAQGTALARRRAGAARTNGHAHPQRLAVLAIPDVSARLLLDAMDDRGIAVDRVVSLWHALAAAWDPAARKTAGADDEIIGAAPVTGVVMVDPAGRLVWSWSRAGELLAAGTIRLPQDRHEMGTGMVRIGRPEIGRLTTDWLSWSVQLGAVPSRLICIAPSIGTEHDSDDMTPAAIGTAIGAAWPGAAVDMAVHDDPIGASLSRLVDQSATHADDSSRELTLLTHRPGRAHRSLYMWAAGCLVLLAAAMAAIGWKGYGSAAEARSDAMSRRASMEARITELVPPAGPVESETVKAKPQDYLNEKLVKKRTAANPQFDEARPILEELYNLSYVLGTREVEIEELNFHYRVVEAHIRVPDTATAEWLKASLASGSAETNCDWTGAFVTVGSVRRGGATPPEWRHQTRYKLEGTWRSNDPPAGRLGGTTAMTGGRP